jgi:cytochrome c oxidase cbb3-type subunit I/II
MLTFGMLYWLFPRMFRVKLYSKKLANQHFWIATLGIILYAIPMYIAGFVQGLMWQKFEPNGMLTNPEFLETVTELSPYYILRTIGGLLFITGAVMMFYNLIKTARSGNFLANEEAEAVNARLAPETAHVKGGREYWHRAIEKRPVRMMLVSIVVVAIGGLVEIIPTMIVESNVKTIDSVKPYTALELEGRDIYVSEGCYNCHSQMIRPLRFETARYGEYSKSGEFVYDHPFQWGSKRTGPDLAREGGKRGDVWHYRHMYDPKSVSNNSIMPAYPWLFDDNSLDLSMIEKKIDAMITLGVPYKKSYIKNAKQHALDQADSIAVKIVEYQWEKIPEKDRAGMNKQALIKKVSSRRVIALIAYLQRLGIDIKKEKGVDDGSDFYTATTKK